MPIVEALQETPLSAVSISDEAPETPANCNWGDDGRTLYITARAGSYRIKLAAQGETKLYEPSL